MVGPFRRFATLLVLVWLVAPSIGVKGQEETPKPAPPVRDAPLAPGDFALPGEDPPRAFVPARPRTVEEQKRVEALRYYATARALEESRQFLEAIKTLEKALVSDPESTAVLRRLCRINFAIGRDGPAEAYGRRVLAAEPGDVETLALLVGHFKDDPPAAEALLNEVANNPKLDKNSVGALFVENELGAIYEASLRFDKAAACFTKVVDALDEKSNARLAPSDLRRLLGNDEAQAYLRFGRVFLQAKKPDLAIKAFQRGLVYDSDEPLLLLFLAQTYQEAGRPAEALGIVERFLRRQPRGRETYDLLVRILTALKRENEIIPRLEKYAGADPKNVPLQYALAERYKASGQAEKAQQIFNALLAEQRDTQDFADNFPRLMKERKSEELLQILVKATGRLKRLDAVKPQIDQLVADPAYTDEVLDTGLKMISASPPAIDPQDGWIVLINIATEGNRAEKLISLLRWSIKRSPNPIVYHELILTLSNVGKHGEAESTLKELVAKFPDERNARNSILLARIQARAGKMDEAIGTARDVLKQEPNESEAVRTLAFLLSQAGRNDEAIETVRNILKADATNPDLIALLGSLLIQVGKNDEAIALFKSLVEKFPNNDEVVRISRSSLSTIYTNMGDFAKGEAELELLFAKNPDDPGVNNDLGYLYADQGKNLEKAESMIRKALTEEPDNYAYLDSLGWVLFKRGKFEDALPPLEKAQADPRADSTIPDHLGDVYFQLQLPAKAKEAWERALKLATQAKPVDKRLPEIRKKIESLKQFEPSPKPKTGDNP